MIFCTGRQGKNPCITRKSCRKYMNLINYRNIPNFDIKKHEKISLYTTQGRSKQCVNIELITKS